MKTIEEYAKAGSTHDVLEALDLLIDAYIQECGISIGFRTLVYNAAEVWQEKLAWMEVPVLSEMARKKPFINLMPVLSEKYAPDIYDDYDISGMDDVGLKNCCEDAINQKEFDEPTLEVICYGVNEMLTKKPFVPKDIKAVANDGTPLYGKILEQNCAFTTVRLITPYDTYTNVGELVKDPTPMLAKIYEDYCHLKSSEKELRELYEQYKKEFIRLANRRWCFKHHLFDAIFFPVLGDSMLSNPRKILTQMYGFEFYDITNDKEPSWCPSLHVKTHN